MTIASTATTAPLRVGLRPSFVPDPPLLLRREQLLRKLLDATELLQRSRADLIPDGYVADYLALRWLERDGVRLTLTDAGRAVCRRLQPERASLPRGAQPRREADDDFVDTMPAVFIDAAA